MEKEIIMLLRFVRELKQIQDEALEDSEFTVVNPKKEK